MTREFQTVQIIPFVVRVELDHSHHVEGKHILEDTSGAEVLALEAPMAAAATRWQTPLRFRPGKQTDVVVEMGCAGRKQESQTVRILNLCPSCPRCRKPNGVLFVGLRRGPVVDVGTTRLPFDLCGLQSVSAPVGVVLVVTSSGS